MEHLANMMIVTNEITVKNNNIQDGVFTLSPRFTRNTGMKAENTGYTELIAEIVNTPDAPFPLDIRVSLTGIFEMNNIPLEQHDSFLKITAVQVLFPYVRNIISTVTASALVPPIVLPIIDVKTLFQQEE